MRRLAEEGGWRRREVGRKEGGWKERGREVGGRFEQGIAGGRLEEGG